MRKLAKVQFLFENDAPRASNVHWVEVALFHFKWETDDDLARKVTTILSQELGEPVVLVSWGLVQ